MQLSAGKLVIETGGKLQSCERRVAKALESLTEASAQHKNTAENAVATVQNLRSRYNLVLAAHVPSVDPILTGDVPAGQQGDTLTLTRDQVWVVESIEDLYARLSAT